MTVRQVSTLLVPVLALGFFVLAWHLVVALNAIPPYILPGPVDTGRALLEGAPTLLPALWVTLRTTLLALALAMAGGVGLAILIVEARWLERAILPFAVILQVTPIIAVAPLILIYAPDTQTALLVCAFLVAFFPILSNAIQGLRSVDRGHADLFALHGASGWQTLLHLRLPASLPFLMTGLRIGGGLALIAAIVAEFVAGSAGEGSGLAFRLIESQYRLDMPRLFAALVLLSGAGIAIYAATSLVSWLALRHWHESVRRED